MYTYYIKKYQSNCFKYMLKEEYLRWEANLADSLPIAMLMKTQNVQESFHNMFLPLHFIMQLRRKLYNVSCLPLYINAS